MRVKIERLGSNGEGIAILNEGEYKDKICFVDFALPQEEVEIEIYENKAKFCRAKLVKIYSKSPKRAQPVCQHFGICGGCDIQHLEHDYQLEFKKDKVKHVIKKFAKIDQNIEEIVSLNEFNYRNKMVFPVRTQNGKTVVGMFKKESHQVIDGHCCKVANTKIIEVFNVVRNYILNSNLKGYDEKTRAGDVKYVVIRHLENQTLVTIIATRKIELSQMFEVLKLNFINVGLSLVIGDSDSEILTGKYIHINGIKDIKLEEFGIKYAVNNRGFLQVNNEIKKALYADVLNEISITDEVIDCYSGAGLLSAIIAKKCKNVCAIEINESACASAENLAKTNNLINMKVYCSDVKLKLATVLKTLQNPVIVLDPPRAGCDAKILETISNKAEKIIYISCDPSTLARDLNILKQNYKINKIKLFDMFPQTSHIETLVVLTRI